MLTFKSKQCLLHIPTQGFREVKLISFQLDFYVLTVLLSVHVLLGGLAGVFGESSCFSH